MYLETSNNSISECEDSSKKSGNIIIVSGTQNKGTKNACIRIQNI